MQWIKQLNAPLEEVDPEIADIIEHEKARQWKVFIYVYFNLMLIMKWTRFLCSLIWIPLQCRFFGICSVWIIELTLNLGTGTYTIREFHFVVGDASCWISYD